MGQNEGHVSPEFQNSGTSPRSVWDLALLLGETCCFQVCCFQTGQGVSKIVGGEALNVARSP